MSLREVVRRSRVWLFAAVAGVAGVGFFASDADADVGRLVTSVFVTNSEANPIPVSDAGRRHQIEQSGMASCSFTVGASVKTGSTTCLTVPSDKVFVIEHVSARAFIPGDHPPLYFSLSHARAATMAGVLTTPLVPGREKGNDGTDVVSVSQPIKTYAGPGTPVGCAVGRTSAHSSQVYVQCVISGYYEDI